MDTARQTESAGGHVTIHEHLPYRPGVDELRMSLFLPDSAGGPVPCVVAIQGGGFASQTGHGFRPFAEAIAGDGFAAALISYRGLPDHTCATTLADVQEAVRYVRTAAGDYAIDPDRIGAFGRSAGGTLAALLGVAPDDRPDAPSSRVQAVVAMAGVYDFIGRFTEDRQAAMQPRLEERRRSNAEWIGATFAPEDADWRRASAIRHVHADGPPMLLLHCKDDATVPWLQSQAMCDAVRSAGGACEVKYSPRGGHGFQTDDGGDAPLQEMLAFFRRTLGR